MSVRAALDALARSLEAPGVSCTVVDMARVDRASPLAAAAARRSDGRRRLFRESDKDWAELSGEAPTSDPLPQWIAAEPLIADDGSTLGAIVLVGAPGADIDALALLPKVAAACTPLLVGVRFARMAGELVHTMNNQLATVLVNVDLALSVLASPPGERDHAELVKSLGFARNATRTMQTQLVELARNTPRVREERDR